MSTAGSSIEAAEPGWVGEVLRFWFDELSAAQWFAKSDALDARIRERFLALHERLIGEEVPFAPSRHRALAMVIVLDQFSRNMYRGHRQAFAADAVARALASSAIERGLDLAMTGEQRMFLYLPFEHAEDAVDQQRSVELFAQLGNQDWTRYALAHQAIIDRFGRFPHRNAVLGRSSSAEEIAFLEGPARSF